jgi:predicted branched-subunit amino acid permease
MTTMPSTPVRAPVGDRPATDVAAPTRGPIASGLRDMLPIVVAVAPFGIVVGVAQTAVDVPLVPGLASAVMVYGGSAHLATLGALAAGTAILGAVLTGALINARLLLYSADIATAVAGQPLWFRVIGSVTIIDQTHALLANGLAHGVEGLRRYWLTIGWTLGAGWLTAITIGARLGDVVPPAVSVAAAPKAVFLAMLLPRLTDGRMRRAVGAAVVVAVLGRGLPAGLGIILALLTAMAVSPRRPTDVGASAPTAATAVPSTPTTHGELVPCPS